MSTFVEPFQWRSERVHSHHYTSRGGKGRTRPSATPAEAGRAFMAVLNAA